MVPFPIGKNKRKIYNHAVLFCAQSRNPQQLGGTVPTTTRFFFYIISFDTINRTEIYFCVMQARAKWQRLVERRFPMAGSQPGPSRESHQGSEISYSGGRGRGGGASRGNRGATRGGFAGGGRGRGSSVNPRPTNLGPPAKVQPRFSPTL
jgi:hypothetical protein